MAQGKLGKKANRVGFISTGSNEGVGSSVILAFALKNMSVDFHFLVLKGIHHRKYDLFQGA